MWKLRLSIVSACGAFALATSAGALGASGGDPNAGDVWVDNVGQPAGPGHEMDPHLACQDINLWGSKLADSSGTYTIDGWQPSGSQEVDYSSGWSYSTSQGGDQVISVINVQQLIANAQANGDTPAAQGYHFKLDFSQDPQKHKTFWIDCPAPSSTSSGSTSSGSTSSGSTSSGSTSSGSTSSESTSSSTSSSSGTSSTAPAGTTAPSSTSSTAPSSTSTTTTQAGTVRASHRRKHARKHKKAKRHTKAHLLRPHRRHHAARRSVKAVTVAAPEFTG